MRRALISLLIPATLACLLSSTASAAPGVFVLGVDGMDPVILERMMGEGRAPNLRALAEEGGYRELETVWPPQSPVAWSTFVTGLDPGGHGVFDFVHRDPATYRPISSATPPESEPPTTLSMFGWHFPLSGGATENTRTGTPWWDRLHAAGVDVEVYRVPGNFPVPDSQAKVLSGMGTVDLRGGYGTYTFFTDTPVAGQPGGDIQLVHLQDWDLDGRPDTASGLLRGPPDIFRLPPGHVPSVSELVSLPVRFHVDPEHPTVLVEVGGQRALLREGEWSGWLPLDYPLLPMGLSGARGQVRFYAKKLRGGFQVYASPVNLASEASPMPITSPEGWAAELAGEVGSFYTQGMPEDTNALKDGVLDDADYLGQVGLVQEDAHRLLSRALAGFAPGDATFVYVSDIDLQCHMLWRHKEPKHVHEALPPHPAHDPALGDAFGLAIDDFYAGVDELVGEVRAALPPDTLLLVMSDHGFQPFTRKVHLNAWLRDQGYLVLRDGKTTGQLPDDIDWSRTRAYGLGFNGLYLNLQGREAQGIVAPEAADALMGEIEAKLLALRDPARGEAAVVRSVARSSAVYQGPRVAEAPDLIVGYDAGYGASDATTLGEVTPGVLVDNTARWSGNHLMDPAVVPGVVLANRPIPAGPHGLADLTVTLLAHYKLAPEPGQRGHDIFAPPRAQEP